MVYPAGTDALAANDPQRELASSKEELPSIEHEIENLHAVGLVNVSGELIGASPAARYMDELLGRPI